MNINAIYNIDCLSGLKSLPDNSVKCHITSPPYLKQRKSYTGYSESEYVTWFEPIAVEMLRTLAPDGSFILNINDGCVKGERSIYVFELIIKLKKLGFKYFDKMIWTKKNGVPNGGKFRRSDYCEYLFQFTKTLKPIFNVDKIRIKYKSSSIERANKPIKNNVGNKESRTVKTYKKWNINPLGSWPNNVLNFSKDSGKSGHPASFHIDLPTHFIQAHSNIGDLICDPFAGKGTTLLAAKNLGRNYIGFELEKKYVDIAVKSGLVEGII